MSITLNPERQAVVRVAELMCIAARTAPKGCGIDNLVTALVSEESDRQQLAEGMRQFGQQVNAPFFLRDAQNVLDADAVVILGTRLQRFNIPGCNFCGYEGCAANEQAGARCSFNLNDLGIALGSAVSIAADHRVDCRIMYTIGRAALWMGLLGPEVHVAHGIPLAARGKNIFFDRK
ncbi:MAG: DUF2148 domain-containing protein [Armatimonadota bacterium]